MTTTTSCSLSQPNIDSFYAAMQRRRLFARMFDEPDGAERLRYEIIAEIGRGGMGIVYQAYHHGLERTVAIKRVRERGDVGLQRRLVVEAKTMARLNHPNVVTIYDIEEVEGTTLIVMEYIDGVTLRHWLHHARPAADEILAAFIDAGEGLIAAHDKGLIHGDFKPSNVMIDGEGRVRVLDFGLARAVSGSRVDEDGLRGGTPRYMAPEQFAGVVADERCDQYAFCDALYAALWGRETTQAADDRPALQDIIRRGMHANPECRHASMRALVDALRGQLRQRTDAARCEPEARVTVRSRVQVDVHSVLWLGLFVICLVLLGYSDRVYWTPVIISALSMCVPRLR